MLPNRPRLEIILAVDVHRDHAAERWEHRSRHDGWPPAVLDRVFPKLLDRHARLAGDDASRGIPREDSVHPCEVDHNIFSAECCIAVAASRASKGYASSRRASICKCGFQLLDRRGTNDVCHAMDGSAPAFQRLKVVDGE